MNVNRKAQEAQQARRADAKGWAKRQPSQMDSTCIKLPDGVDWFKFPAPGTYSLDFMSYVVGQGNHYAEEGMVHFEREYCAHRIPNATGSGTYLYTCRTSEFRQRCAACDFVRTYARTGDPKLIKSLYPPARHLWLVNDKPGNANNPIKVFDTGHKAKGTGFGEMMQAALNAVEDYSVFADLQGGMTLKIQVVEDVFPGGKWNKPIRIDFLPRKYDYPESMLDEMICLDDCVVDPGYDPVADLLAPLAPDAAAITVPVSLPPSTPRTTPRTTAPRTTVRSEEVDDTEESAPPDRTDRTLPRTRSGPPASQSAPREEEYDLTEDRPTPTRTASQTTTTRRREELDADEASEPAPQPAARRNGSQAAPRATERDVDEDVDEEPIRRRGPTRR